ncbi:MAG: hypothetical protein H7834_00155 [Magnetococcus sp. YQC-9]
MIRPALQGINFVGHEGKVAPIRLIIEGTRLLADHPIKPHPAWNESFLLVSAARQGRVTLGFTHYCRRTRDGKRFRMKRTTIGKRFTAKLKIMKEWLKSNRHRPIQELMPIMAAKLRGHYAYYGVTDNSHAISRFGYEARRMLFKWLDRRGKRGSMNWGKFSHFLDMFPLSMPRIRVNLL